MEEHSQSALPASDEASLTTSAPKPAQDFLRETVHTPSLESVQMLGENLSPDCAQKPVQNEIQTGGQRVGKQIGTRKRTAPSCPSKTALNQRRYGSMGDTRTRAENTTNSPTPCTISREKVDLQRVCNETEQPSVYCISKSDYRVNDTDREIAIRPFSSCSQVKGACDNIDPTFSSNSLDECDRVEVIVDPHLDQCPSSKQLNPTHSKLTDSTKLDGNKPLARNERDSLKQALCRAGGVGMGVGVVPTVALAVPIMFGVSGTDPRLCVGRRLLAPSAENRRNHRLCSKLGRYPKPYPSQYTTQRFSRCRAKLSFVHDKKHVCSKRRLCALISLIFLVGCCLALATCFNKKVEGFFDEREDRAEELSLDPGDKELTRSLIANWSPWTEWSECSSGITERSRFRQCVLGNGTGQILVDIQQCLMAEDEPKSGDIEVDDCPNYTTAPQDNVISVTVFLQDAGESEVGQSIVPTTSGAARHCDECVGDEVCVALAREEVPECRAPLDSRDPTGCAGHCRLGVEMCRQLDRDAFRCLEQQHCFDTEFQCANLLCIPGSKRCDGHNNCYDESDEYDCDCDLQTHFHCHNQTSCLALKKRCDGIIDCWDGSDEVNCTNACPGDEVMCSSGSCIRRAYFCDGLRDCADGSDEPFGCGEHCHRHELTCGNGRCVSARSRCDGLDDCGDATDEKDCPGLDNLPAKSTVLYTVH